MTMKEKLQEEYAGGQKEITICSSFMGEERAFIDFFSLCVSKDAEILGTAPL